MFDLDGVLVDSESVWDAARRALVTETGGRWRATATTDMLGMSAPEWSEYLHDELANLNLQSGISRAYARFLLTITPHPDIAASGPAK